MKPISHRSSPGLCLRSETFLNTTIREGILEFTEIAVISFKGGPLNETFQCWMIPNYGEQTGDEGFSIKFYLKVFQWIWENIFSFLTLQRHPKLTELLCQLKSTSNVSLLKALHNIVFHHEKLAKKLLFYEEKNHLLI